MQNHEFVVKICSPDRNSNAHLDQSRWTVLLPKLARNNLTCYLVNQVNVSWKKKSLVRKIPFIFLWISLFLCVFHTLSFFLTETSSFTYLVFCMTTRESNYYYFIEQILAKYVCFCLHSNLNCFWGSWKAKLDVGLMESLWSGVNSTRPI